MSTIASLLWDEFQIEGRAAAFASHATYEKWAARQVVAPDEQSAAAVWNDALRLGFLLGAGRVTLGEIE